MTNVTKETEAYQPVWEGCAMGKGGCWRKKPDWAAVALKMVELARPKADNIAVRECSKASYPTTKSPGSTSLKVKLTTLDKERISRELGQLSKKNFWSLERSDEAPLIIDQIVIDLRNSATTINSFY
ncbi:hypothetical protein BDB00DRAFT_791527 [Zychaea mexicana]|uniref:uncharacterized protein n=1 Tax=Zychaea mexicana TaxID=64656 RepID=UPI0022FF38FD|nr:uncharacterized protein BDB00DRAFT_791527 [Zychaea mexicana]KAI9488925.1 hypothetical protein BDB00DRAFT_791527 [Zychaea mexicana]